MTICNEDRIERFLRDELSQHDVTDFESHLENCPLCRTSLDDSAAEASWWKDASNHLSDDEIDLEPVSTFLGEVGSAETRRTKAETQAAVRQFLKHLDPTDDPRMLGRFGGYEIAGVIGAGGMSFVLKGFDSALNRYVAIKVMSPHLATSESARQRFAREAQAAAAVVHDNVIAIHHVRGDAELPYLVMPYERGNSLQKRLDERGPLEVAEILRIGMQSAAGLAAAHAQGLVHRDVKPGNILLTENVERVKLTDFGLARAVDDASLTRTGMIAGTTQYLSPEQARGDAVDQRSDLFSLGSVLYAMCTGKAPFRADTSYGALMKITESVATPIEQLNPSVPTWLCSLIRRLHAKSPEERYQSAADAEHHLQRCLRHVQNPGNEGLPAWLRETQQSKNRNTIWVWAGLLCFIFTVSYALWKRDGKKQSSPTPGKQAEHVDQDREISLPVKNEDQPASQEPAAMAPLENEIEWELIQLEGEILQLEEEVN